MLLRDDILRYIFGERINRLNIILNYFVRSFLSCSVKLSAMHITYTNMQSALEQSKAMQVVVFVSCIYVANSHCLTSHFKVVDFHFDDFCEATAILRIKKDAVLKRSTHFSHQRQQTHSVYSQNYSSTNTFNLMEML